MNQELKSCIHCGDQDGPMLAGNGEFTWVYCDACGACGPQDMLEEKAIAAWNRRADALEGGVTVTDAMARAASMRLITALPNEAVGAIHKADYSLDDIAAAVVRSALSAPAQRVEEGWVAVPRSDVEFVVQIANRNEQSTEGDRLASLLAASPAPQRVEEGWKLVPFDATDAMIEAARAVDMANENEDGALHNVWHVMLAASPAPAPHAGNEMGENLFNALHPFIGSANSTRVAVQELHRLGLTSAPHAGVDTDVPDYDAGLLNDFGGGDVSWWQDYLRAEIERANQHWRAALGDRT